MNRPRIRVLLDEVALPGVVGSALEAFGAEVTVAPLQTPILHHDRSSFDAQLVITANTSHMTGDKLSTLLAAADEHPCATLVVSDGPTPCERISGEAIGERVIGFAQRPSHDDLIGRLTGMCGMRHAFRKLQRKLDTLQKKETAHQSRLHRLEQERRQAAAMQRDLLPTTLPEIHGAELTVLYRPVDQVSGDLYDVVRLDDEQVAIALLDATGHGVSAGLLVASFQRALMDPRALIAGGPWIEPAARLAALNREVIHAGLEQCQFVAALYAIYNERTNVLRWARAGTPYPILCRPGNTPVRIPSTGPAAGISREASFEVREVHLGRGETILFSTDGLDTVSLPGEADRAKHGDLDESWWLRALGQRGRNTHSHFQQLSRFLDTSSHPSWKADDVTLLALQTHAAAACGAAIPTHQGALVSAAG